jgi:hypothetical protein
MKKIILAAALSASIFPCFALGLLENSNTGYSLLFNYSDLNPGAHSLRLYAALIGASAGGRMNKGISK